MSLVFLFLGGNCILPSMKPFCILLLSCFSAFAQPADTLFFKNFNDRSASSNSPGGEGSFSIGPVFGMVSSSSDLGNLDASPCLMVDMGSVFFMSALMGSGQPFAPPIFNVSLSNLDYDSVYIHFDLKANHFGLFYPYRYFNMGNKLGTANLFYMDTVSKKESGKNYDLLYTRVPRFKTVGLEGDVTMDNPNLSEVATYTEKASVAGKTDLFFQLVEDGLPQDTFKVSVLSQGTTSSIVNLKELKNFLISDFCKDTEHPAACFTSATVMVMPPLPTIDLRRHFLVDNIRVLGKRKPITTDLEHFELKNEPRKVLKAYSFQGQEITDIVHYKGPAIILYEDGSKSKEIR